MKIIKLKNDTRGQDHGYGEPNTGGTGDGRGYSSGRASGYGNDGLRGDGTGHGRGEDKQFIKEYKTAIKPKQKVSKSEQK